MRRRLATLMAAALLALALGAAPALADGRGDNHESHWVIVNTDTTDLGGAAGTDLGGMLDCSTAHHLSSYTIVSGFVDQVEMYRGVLDASGLAHGVVQGVETWTLRDVRVKSDQTHRIYRVAGSSRLEVTLKDGATYGAGPFTSGSFVQDVRVGGTRDGRSFTQVLNPNNQTLVMKSDHGTCSNLQVGLN
jgi:hypothetical protein